MKRKPTTLRRNIAYAGNGEKKIVKSVAKEIKARTAMTKGADIA
jgi:hypothetical protein